MTLPGFVLAYHGCDRKVGEQILSGAETVQPSGNDYDWLGPGAYFWENSPRRAFDWAAFLSGHPKYSRHPINEPFVIGAIIDPGLCLDLIEARGLIIFRRAFDILDEAFKNSGLQMPKNEPGFPGDEDLVKRHLDCAVATFLHDFRERQRRPPFQTLRAAFFEGEKLYPGAGFAARTHIQWCVRDPRQSIRGYFRPVADLDDEN